LSNASHEASSAMLVSISSGCLFPRWTFAVVHVLP